MNRRTLFKLGGAASVVAAFPALSISGPLTTDTGWFTVTLLDANSNPFAGVVRSAFINGRLIVAQMDAGLVELMGSHILDDEWAAHVEMTN